MLRTVYDQVTETEFFVSNINLVDEEPVRYGTTTYEIDLVSYNDDTTLFNVPLTVTEDEDGNYTYAMPDISEIIDLMITIDKDTYDYHGEKRSHLYDCKYSDGVLTSTGAFHSEPHTMVSIYQDGKEPLTQEATTIPDLIEILEYAQKLDYTEVFVSGVFTSKSKGIRMVGKDDE